MKLLNSSDLQAISGASFVVDILDPGFTVAGMIELDTSRPLPPFHFDPDTSVNDPGFNYGILPCERISG